MSKIYKLSNRNIAEIEEMISILELIIAAGECDHPGEFRHDDDHGGQWCKVCSEDV